MFKNEENNSHDPLRHQTTLFVVVLIERTLEADIVYCAFEISGHLNCVFKN